MNARTLLIAPLLIVGLAACGGDDDSSGGSSGDFCTLARKLDEGSFDAFSSAESPEAVEAAVNDVVGKLNAAVAVAPDEIEGSMNALRDLYGEISTGLEAYDYDLTAFFTSEEGTAVFEDFDATQFDELETYLADECGIATES